MRLRNAAGSRSSKVAKPLIAIDVDEVLFPFNTGLVDWHNIVHGTSLTLDEVTSFKLDQVWGGTEAEATAKVGAYQDHPGALEGNPLPGALEAINALKQWYELVIVTSRQQKVTTQTEAWIQRHFPHTFRDVHFARYWDDSKPRLSKADLCLELGVEVLIDDHLDYVGECAERGMRGILFGDYPWNQAERLPQRVVRATGWPAAVRLLGA